MYYRSPAYIDIASLTRAICVLSEAKPLSLASRLLLSAGMIVTPVLVLVVVLGTGRLRSGLCPGNFYGILIFQGLFPSRIYMRFRPIDGRPFGDLIMLDIIFIAAGLAFFAVTLAYTHICERL